MTNSNISIQERTKIFAIRVVNAYTQINQENHFNDAVVILGKQFLRSGTSIGANCKEAVSAQSQKDFISKYEIALKEARETEYWIELMIETKSIKEEKFTLLKQEISEIIKILVATINSLKKKLLTSDF
ncbi:MAG: four helix bundle protein [Waterburya sp.]